MIIVILILAVLLAIDMFSCLAIYMTNPDNDTYQGKSDYGNPYE